MTLALQSRVAHQDGEEVAFGPVEGVTAMLRTGHLLGQGGVELEEVTLLVFSSHQHIS